MTWDEDQTVADLAAATNRTIEEARDRLRRALADIDDWEHKDNRPIQQPQETA